MQQLQGRVAVVTGGASGIGLAMAERFAAAGMSVVLADVERPALERAAARFDPARVLAVPTDVTDADAVTALAETAVDRFGAVHVVCANAGVGSRGLPIAELPVADFRSRSRTVGPSSRTCSHAAASDPTRLPRRSSTRSSPGASTCSPTRR